MKRLRWLALISLAALFTPGCDPGTENETHLEIGTRQQGVSAGALLNLKWVMWSRPGRVTLSRRTAASGNVSVVKTYAFSSHWRAVGVAGNKLLWRRADTGQLSLWTIDIQGRHVRHVYLSPPAGFTAVGLSATDDITCPRYLDAHRKYMIVMTRRGYFPRYHVVDDAGRIKSTRIIRQYIWGADLQDVRQDRWGKWDMLWSDATGNATVIEVDLNNSHRRLSTLTFQRPATGYRATSLLAAQNTISALPVWSDSILWSRDDGRAQIMRYDWAGSFADSQLLYPGGGIWRATSYAGADQVALTCKARIRLRYTSQYDINGIWLAKAGNGQVTRTFKYSDFTPLIPGTTNLNYYREVTMDLMMDHDRSQEPNVTPYYWFEYDQEKNMGHYVRRSSAPFFPGVNRLGPSYKLLRETHFILDYYYVPRGYLEQVYRGPGARLYKFIPGVMSNPAQLTSSGGPMGYNLADFQGM